MSSPAKSRHPLLPYLICTLAACFYVYEYFLRVFPSVMTTQLMSHFHITAEGIGFLSAFFYYAYTPMQIPAGLLYDRYGPRALMSMFIFACAMGTFVFALTDSYALACFGRFFMGFGSAFAFIGALVLATRWFPAKYFAFIVGLIQAMGSLGAIAGETPMAMAVKAFNWRPTIVYTAILGIVLAVLFWLIIRDRPAGQIQPPKATKPDGSEAKKLSLVLKKPQTWAVALYGCAIWAPVSIFAVLWGIPFIKSVYHISSAQAGTFVSAVWIGIAVGGPVIGWISNLVNLRKLPLCAMGIIGFIAAMIAIYVPVHMTLMYVLLFIFGFGCGGQSLSFGVVQDINDENVIGTAIGFNNMAVVTGALFFQPMVGYLLKAHEAVGTIVYTANDYRDALWIVPLCFLVATIASGIFLKETHCKPVLFNRH